MHYLSQLLSNTLADILALAILSGLTWLFALRRIVKLPLPRYRRHLHEQLKMMPFIYGDLTAEVLNDFVEIEIQVLDESSRTPRGGHRSYLRNLESIQRSRRVIFLGDAGIGKTTFQRSAILSILKSPKRSPFVYPDESPIPVYVPLKLVDNIGPFPIIRFLLEANELFNNDKGLHTLTEYAEKKRLFLFLDGYDEISADLATNYLKDELASLFGPPPRRSRRTVKDEKPEFRALIAKLKSCRIWLSSRSEFFELNPVPLELPYYAGADTVAALQIGGVGANRPHLVKNIFEKYRQRNPHLYGPLLNEEYFISEVDRSPGLDIREISYNPLFLTVMCYVYVTEVAKQGRHDVICLERGLEDLLLVCIRLLLIDLDSEKARDLPRAHREGLLRRRNEYAKEKEAFLMYFAAELLFDGIPAFTVESLRTHAVSFFRSEEWPTGGEILRQIGNPDTQPDLALQMIYVGIFVLVSRSTKQSYYDFPHRRFREILALQYVKNPASYCRALLQVDRLHFQEFLLLLRKSEFVRQRSFQVSALQHMLDMATTDSQPERDIAASRNFFRVMPHEINLVPEITAWLTNMANHRAPCFVVAKDLIHICQGDERLAQVLTETVESSLAAREAERFAFAIQALELDWPLIASEILRRRWREMAQAPLIRVFAAQSILAITPELVPIWVAESERRESMKDDFLYAMAHNVSKDWTNPTQWSAVYSSLPRIWQAQVLGFVRRFATARFEPFRHAIASSVHGEWLDFAFRTDPIALREIKAKGEPLYVGTRAALSTLGEKTAGLDKAYVRFRIPRVIDTIGDTRTTREYSDACLNGLAPILDPIRSTIERCTGARIGGWAELVQKLTAESEEWLKERKTSHDYTASTNRTQVAPDAIPLWLTQPMEAQLQIKEDILEILRAARHALSYVPPHISDFFA